MKKYTTIEFYNENDEYEGAIRIKNWVTQGTLQDEIWQVCDHLGWVHYEEDDEASD